MNLNLNRIDPQTDEEIAAVKEELEDMFKYKAWTMDQIEAGNTVRRALQDAALAIIKNVPASPDRSTAIRKLREARMDANSAITHGGKH